MWKLILWSIRKGWVVYFIFSQTLKKYLHLGLQCLFRIRHHGVCGVAVLLVIFISHCPKMNKSKMICQNKYFHLDYYINYGIWNFAYLIPLSELRSGEWAGSGLSGSNASKSLASSPSPSSRGGLNAGDPANSVGSLTRSSGPQRSSWISFSSSFFLQSKS